MINFTQNTPENPGLVTLWLRTKKTLFSLSFLFLFLLGGQLANAQRSHISASNGGFENATTITPAGNGWTISGVAAGRDAWCVSGNPTAGFSGSYCAHVSNNYASTKTYTTNATGTIVNHLWRTIDLTAYPLETTITLTFKWLCTGDGANDRMRVFLALSSYTPTTVVMPAANGTQIGQTNYSSTTPAWATETITIPASYAGTIFKLDFEWRNNGAVPGNLPAAIDDVTFTTDLPNNECAGAIDLTVYPDATCTTSTSGTTIGASQSQAGCAGTADDDVWFQFTPTATSHILTVTPGTLSDAVFQVFSGSCGSLSQIACVNSTSGASVETTTLSGLTIGVPYYVRVHSFANGSGQGTFTICVTTPVCTAPAAQASGFALGTVTSTAVPASFTGSADGYLVIQSTSATPPSQPADGTLYTTTASLSGLGAGLTFIQSGSSTTIPSSGLTGNTQYYYYVYAYNNTNCTGGPIYNAAGPLTGNGITCPAVPNSVATASITNSGFTLNWAAPTGGSAAAITYTVQVTTDSGYTTNIAGSPFTGISALTLNITGLTGSTQYYYRILANNGCSSAYVTGNITTQATCVAPASQASGFTLGTLTSTSVPASFTGTASGFLVIQSTSATPPSQPVNGTLYTTTASLSGLGAGLTFIQSGSSTTIPSSGLTGNTKYYYYIYAYNNTACGGGPVYTTGGALTGNGTTCPAVPNTVTTASITANSFTLNWAAPTGGSSSAITYTVQVTTDSGYTANIAGSPFTGISALTLNVTGLAATTLYYYRILANNGCSSTYVTGNVTTLVATPCSNATTLACGTVNQAGTTVGSTLYTNGTGCTLADYGAWYTFVGDGLLNTISCTATAGGFDHEMAIASGTCGSLTNVTCQDLDGNSGTETYSFMATVGVTYYVYIAHKTAGSTTTGPFTISRTCEAYNPCATLPLSCGVTTNVVIPSGNGVYNPPSTSCGYTTPGKEQIYTFTPTITGNYSISQLNNYFYTDYFYKAASSGCNGTGWTCIGAGTGAASSANFTLTAGVAYYFLVDTENTNGGTISFAINCPITNDDCAGALPVSVNATTSCTVSTSGTTVGATQSQAACSGTADDDVWFKFVATTTSHSVSVVQGSLSNAVLQVFSGSCGSLVSLGCINSATTYGETTTLTGLTIGATYYIRVYSSASGSGQGTFTVCVTTCTPGNGTGTTSLGCPNVIVGVDASGTPPTPIDCKAPVCVDLQATYLNLGQTTNYTVASIPYAPPYQFGCLANRVSVNVDDVWSSAISLPFNFCYYGNSYNSCVVGSNGMLSFNTAYAGTASGFQFNNSLPSTTGALFANTIYGVYHDIDPSKAGQVGYELITLNTGCRALVASWSDVPMFYNNNLLYTGMMVLYENTNVIEVYIREKRVDGYYAGYAGPWNYGNAIVGVQNAAGTAAVVAPGRNGLDTDWSATTEAWRFTPSGTSITTVKWYEGSGTTGPVLATTNNVQVCPLATTTYTAEVTYSLCNGTTLKKTAQTTVTVTGGKIWNGSVDTDWNKPANWTPSNAIPTASDCVIIPNVTNKPIISGSSYVGLAGTLTIYNNALLTVNASNIIAVTDWVNVNTGGTFLLNNTSSLVQINNVANTGNIIYKRDTLIRSLDYVYWSSPVNNYSVNSIASPLAFSAIYKWNTTVANANGGQGNWESASGNSMTKGKGYIARAPSSFTSTPSTFTGTFTGVPNNGDITTPISRGDITTSAGLYPAAPYTGTNGAQISNYSDNWNLVGNPYPSSIRASQFLFDNRTKILGNVKLWTHGNQPIYTTSPFYNSFAFNYSSGDYLTFNFVGASCCPAAGSDLFIGAGQGFFVQMVDGAAATDNISFNNNLRSSTYTNSVFYKSANRANSDSYMDVDSLERNRIWLDLIDSTNKTNRTLFGYVENATMGNDHFFDCITKTNTEIQIYSLIDDSKFTIQGRALPFDEYDEVPIGIDVHAAGTHTIAIAAVDGLFNTQKIYLKDNLLNITHDLKASPYQFIANVGVIDNRFKVVYVNSTLGTPTLSLDNSIKVNTNNEVAVSSNNFVMESVIVYNVLGQKLISYDNIDSNHITLSGLHKNNTTLLLKIKLQTGETVTKKVIY